VQPEQIVRTLPFALALAKDTTIPDSPGFSAASAKSMLLLGAQRYRPADATDAGVAGPR